MTVAEREQDPERTPAVDLRLMEAEPDGLEFKLSRATSRAGVPMTLMVGPRDAPKGKRWDEPTRNKTWRPPVSSGQLCPVGRAYADQMPGGDDLLAWYRSHGRERQHEVMHWLLRWAQCSDWERFAGPLQAATVLSWAMERVRSGRRRIRPTRPPHMGETQFEHLLSEASAWLRSRIMDAEYRYWQTLQEPAAETPASRHTDSEGSHSVHYPAKPNCFLRKANPRAPEAAFEFDQAA
jgi:hypothetical protein